jgi:8-oxo-dGTP diphosphatase
LTPEAPQPAAAAAPGRPASGSALPTPGGPTPSASRPPNLHRHPGDGWVECACGRRHWGVHGAAGLLLARRSPDGAVDAVVLQHRALWSDHGGTWGIPGGAIGPHETAEQGALRESAEEAGIPLEAVRVLGSVVLDHGTWRYTTVLAETLTSVEPAATDAESLEVAWVPADDVAGLPLLPAFADAWPGLRAMLESPAGFDGVPAHESTTPTPTTPTPTSPEGTCT